MFCIFITFFMANIAFLLTKTHPKIYLKYLSCFFLHISGMLLIFWLSLFIKRISYSSPSVTSISWSNPINICYIFDCLQMVKQNTKQKYIHPKCIQLEISMLWCYILLKRNMKSDNLQYDTLVRWADVTNDSSIKLLMFQVFFHNFLQNSLQKSFFNNFFY